MRCGAQSWPSCLDFLPSDNCFLQKRVHVRSTPVHVAADRSSAFGLRRARERPAARHGSARARANARRVGAGIAWDYFLHGGTYDPSFGLPGTKDAPVGTRASIIIALAVALAYAAPLFAAEHRSRTVTGISTRASLPFHGAHDRCLPRISSTEPHRL